MYNGIIDIQLTVLCYFQNRIINYKYFFAPGKEFGIFLKIKLIEHLLDSSKVFHAFTGSIHFMCYSPFESWEFGEFNGIKTLNNWVTKKFEFILVPLIVFERFEHY
jgi:hypothetical protein